MRKKGGKPYAVSSQHGRLTAVKSFFRFLYRRGYVFHDPAATLQLPRMEKRLPRTVLTREEARKILDGSRSRTPRGLRDRAILETLYETGIRRGECCRLDLMDLDLSQATLLVRNGKGRKDRLVPVPGRAAAAIDGYLRESRPELARDPRETALFRSGEGQRLHPTTIHLLVRKHARVARLPLPPSVHALRHACATHLLAGGAAVRHVQRLLGHRSIETTAVYTKVGVRDLRAALRKAHPRERRCRRDPHI